MDVRLFALERMDERRLTCVGFDSRENICIVDMIDQDLSVDVMLNTHRAHVAMYSREQM